MPTLKYIARDSTGTVLHTVLVKLDWSDDTYWSLAWGERTRIEKISSYLLTRVEAWVEEKNTYFRELRGIQPGKVIGEF